MFIRQAGRSYRGTEQVAWGWFLIVFQREWNIGTEPQPLELRACIRYVHLAQMGHFMMGTVRVGKHSVTLSGTYGHDGLPCTAPPDMWAVLHPLPKDLQDAFWSGGGHNSAGSEAPLLDKWANAHFSDLHAAGSTRYLKRRPHGEQTRSGHSAGGDEKDRSR